MGVRGWTTSSGFMEGTGGPGGSRLPERAGEAAITMPSSMMAPIGTATRCRRLCIGCSSVRDVGNKVGRRGGLDGGYVSRGDGEVARNVVGGRVPHEDIAG